MQGVVELHLEILLCISFLENMYFLGNVSTIGWLRLGDSFKLLVSFAKEPYTRDDILQKRPMMLRSLLIVATPYVFLLQ